MVRVLKQTGLGHLKWTLLKGTNYLIEKNSILSKIPFKIILIMTQIWKKNMINNSKKKLCHINQYYLNQKNSVEEDVEMILVTSQWAKIITLISNSEDLKPLIQQWWNILVQYIDIKNLSWELPVTIIQPLRMILITEK